MKTAVQLYTLREQTKTPEGFRECLRRSRDIGYDGVQLSAVGCMSGDHPEVDAPTARKWLDEFELECCATHRSWTQLTQQTAQEIQFHLDLGCSYVAVPGIASEFGYDPHDYRRFLAEAEPLAEVLTNSGIKFGYHNHAHEFIRDRFTNRPCLEILTNPENSWLEMEVDTYWVAEAGVCPAEFLKLCSGRIHAIHVKDREVVQKDGAVMAPVGEGNLNWSNILQVCRAGGTEWLIVEQDICRRDPFSCLESSWTYITECLCE